MQDLFKVDCKVSHHCASEGASCRNCTRNKNVKIPKDEFRAKVTFVDFIAKKIVVEEGAKIKAQAETVIPTSNDLV